jgi:hypothetical protein
MQATFIAFYERLMRELSADEAVYFADAVHPEYQTKPAFGWVKVGSNPAVLSNHSIGTAVMQPGCFAKPSASNSTAVVHPTG